ncbi:MAG TPA: glycosyl hydrolase 115 family protein [Chitinophagaceae bacterium]|nr:glycosyl hydrolase 115 family protein [Chitinophagaceae bacterium]
MISTSFEISYKQMTKGRHWIYRIVLFACLLFVAVATDAQQKFIILYGEESSATEKATCEDLQHDLQLSSNATVLLGDESQAAANADVIIVAGTATSCRLIRELQNESKLAINVSNWKPGAGLIQVVQHPGKILILAGADVAGMQNAVYEFSSSVLGVDPLAYWTGSKPVKKLHFDLYALPLRLIKAPVVPIICYFENDVDELANLKKPYLEYDMETWKALVNSLRRLHYNAIQFFDMLGRAEFFTREPYKLLRPDYHANMKLVDSFIEYAHLKGMKIQIDMGLGYEVKAISDEEAVCWKRYRQKWIDTWVYYLTHTALGKGDIYSLRPRNQVWDRAYVSTCGENKVAVFNEVYTTLDSVLRIYKPDALKVCICYDDGMDMFNQGFAPPKDFIVVWSDDGYGNFDKMPDSSKGYSFGTYMHAGFWKNHTVHDPYPERIDTVMNLMRDKYAATSYLQVNGQTFRPFLLNLQAFAQWAVDPAQYNGETFYKNWSRQYFGKAAAPFAIQSFKYLHEAQFGRNGYVQNLSEIKRLITYLQIPMTNELSGKANQEQLLLLSGELEMRRAAVNKSLQWANSGTKQASGSANFYYDYVVLPATMYWQLLDFEHWLMEAAIARLHYETDANKSHIDKALHDIRLASEQLNAIYQTCNEGDRDPKWKTWYDPVKRRPNNGFPTRQMVKSIQSNLQKIKRGE